MNKLSVNIDKCHVMLISVRNTSWYSLKIDNDGVIIPHVRSAKYLGVVIDSQLTWTIQPIKLEVVYFTKT